MVLHSSENQVSIYTSPCSYLVPHSQMVPCLIHLLRSTPSLYKGALALVHLLYEGTYIVTLKQKSDCSGGTRCFFGIKVGIGTYLLSVKLRCDSYLLLIYEHVSYKNYILFYFEDERLRKHLTLFFCFACSRQTYLYSDTYKVKYLAPLDGSLVNTDECNMTDHCVMITQYLMPALQ